MKVEGLLKVGIAVKDLDETVSVLAEALNQVPEDVVTYEPGEMRYCLFTVGDTMVEVMEPTAPGGPIGRFISAHGEGLQHITLKVSNLEEAIAGLRRRGVRFVQETPVCEKVSFGTVRFVFLRPQSCHGVLVQLMECTYDPTVSP